MRLPPLIKRRRTFLCSGWNPPGVSSDARGESELAPAFSFWCQTSDFSLYPPIFAIEIWACHRFFRGEGEFLLDYSHSLWKGATLGRAAQFKGSETIGVRDFGDRRLDCRR